MKVLVTDSVHEIMISGLIEREYSVDYKPNLLLNDLGPIIPAYSGLVINSKIKMDRTMIDLGENLQFIARLGSGLEIIDLDYAAEKNIQVFSAPEGNRNAVAEHVMAMLLSMSNHLSAANSEVRKKIWNREKNRGFELEGKKIGILGFGNTGSSLAKKLLGFDVQVLAYDKYKSNYAEAYSHVLETDLENVITNSDAISFHLPLTLETHHFADYEFIDQCKDGVIIINTSRGSVVKIEDLIPALESKKVAFACLDVFENEKPKTYTPEEEKMYSKLFNLKNVILTPHIAGWTIESKRKLSQVLLDKIDKWLMDIDANR